jgi:hypothetical protein
MMGLLRAFALLVPGFLLPAAGLALGEPPLSPAGPFLATELLAAYDAT